MGVSDGGTVSVSCTPKVSESLGVGESVSEDERDHCDRDLDREGRLWVRVSEGKADFELVGVTVRVAKKLRVSVRVRVRGRVRARELVWDGDPIDCERLTVWLWVWGGEAVHVGLLRIERVAGGWGEWRWWWAVCARCAWAWWERATRRRRAAARVRGWCPPGA